MRPLRKMRVTTSRDGLYATDQPPQEKILGPAERVELERERRAFLLGIDPEPLPVKT